MQQAEIQWGPPARALIAAGPRLCEALLLERLDLLLEHRQADLLKAPIRLVVPSKSLRHHVLGRILSHRGRAVVGLDCRTHHGLALAVTELAETRAAIQTDLFPLYARRFAHLEPPLRRTLEHLNDGYASILSSVGDLLDAGLDPAHVEALDEVLEGEGPAVATAFEVERAKSLVRIAAKTTTALGDEGLGRSSHLLQAAAVLVRERPELLPSSAVLVYGYNDATALTTDFLLALVQTFGGEFLLDDPPDPVRLETPDTGVQFAEIYRERIEAAVGTDRLPDPPAAPKLELFRALGAEAESRETARRIRDLLDDGARPEGIGVVTRRLAPYRRSIRTHFERLGVPFSGVARIGPKHPSTFRVGAMLEILRQQEQTPIERWLDAQRLAGERRNDLELGLHALGVARLAEAADLDVRRFVGQTGKSNRGLRLPVRAGLEAGEGEPRARHRYLAAEALAAARDRAKRLRKHLFAWSTAKTLRAHLDHLEVLLAQCLEWQPDSDLWTSFAGDLDSWSRGMPDQVELDFQEFSSLLWYRFKDFGATELGGRGGGVQVLDVVEARSRTFEHLFVLGLNRGTFPRVVQEDPLLPDRLREIVSRHGFGVLPDLPRKLTGFDEERYLFAQLMASSPTIVLSWLEVDDDHVFRTPSPLIERLRWSRRSTMKRLRQPASAPPLFSEPESTSTVAEHDVRPAFERATIAGIYGTREQFAGLLSVAEGESHERFPIECEAGDAEIVSETRLRVLDEMDPVRGTGAGEGSYNRLGPYFGFVGPASEEADPRRRERLFVTTLESVARCPWRTFVERVLRVEALPDPLEVLPGVSPLLIGNLVHRTLEDIVDRSLEQPLDDLGRARESSGVRVEWPPVNEFTSLLAANARAVALDEGITLPGFDRVLAGVCRGHLESARELDWIDGKSRFRILASEEYGEVSWSDPPAKIGFKADRIDRNDDRLIFTDYKTGKGLGGESQYRRKDRQLLVEAVTAGERLQAALYARAGGGDQDVGRYAFLSPGLDPARDREIIVRANDEEIGGLLERAIRAALSTWQQGTFFPRLTHHRFNAEPVTCSYCAVAEACLRGDSGSRSRLRDWSQARHPDRGSSSALGATEIAVLRTWYLGDPKAFAAGDESGST